jgi:hypothetical protein
MKKINTQLPKFINNTNFYKFTNLQTSFNQI